MSPSRETGPSGIGRLGPLDCVVVDAGVVVGAGAGVDAGVGVDAVLIADILR